MQKYSFEAFTAPCEILLTTSSKEQGQRAYQKVYENSKRLERTFSYFSKESELYNINNRHSNSCVISRELSALLRMSLLYKNVTKGVFDVAWAGTIKPFSNTSTYDEYQAKVEQFRPYASCENIHLHDNTVIFSNRFTKLDLGGLVKEYAVDQAAQILRNCGIDSALINFGGDMAAIGMCGDAPWKIGIENPFDSKKCIMTVELKDASLCTSGHSKRYRQIGSHKISHVPKFNLVEDNDFIQITLISPTTVDAGVWSTALLVDSNLTLPQHVKLVKGITHTQSLEMI